ncbi:gamma-type small acid-soluble spore protein [Bacillus sp. CGMCC 1.16607]|uniref:gamma-type small acid-soluble spore protein n=1 Tax=Bacillus sp. CGMCC 1.16607 TaxID=3351842 RepID=UPI00363400AA
MANFNQKPNKTQAGTNIQEVRQQNAQAGAGSAGAFGTEFASETNAAEVRAQNARSASGGAGAGAAGAAGGQFGAEFASETDAAEVRKQNQQSQANKAKNSGNFGQQ